MIELTEQQTAVAEELAEQHHLVMVEMIGDDWAWLVPCDFCPRCGGDGIDPDSYDDTEFKDCPQCRGQGGVAAMRAPRLVLPDGVEVSQ